MVGFGLIMYRADNLVLLFNLKMNFTLFASKIFLLCSRFHAFGHVSHYFAQGFLPSFLLMNLSGYVPNIQSQLKSLFASIISGIFN